jgi:tetratricopeptide (TPR) repeat protein
VAWRAGAELRIYELARRGTADAYAEAIERAPAIRDRLLFDLGNRYFEEAQRLHEAGPTRAALSYYEEALRLDPGFLEAKKNYELARRFLDGLVPPRDPREPRPPDRARSSQMPLHRDDI